MSLKTTELNKLHKLKQKVRLVNLDIQFLKKCKRNKIFPKFIKINIPIRNQTTEKVLHNAKMNWLNLEIKNHYSKQSNLELQAMEQHLKITKMLLPFEYDEFEYKYEQILQSIEFKHKSKLQKLEKKFLNLYQKIHPNSNTDQENNIFSNDCLIHNQSSETFSEEELNLLNKGLQFNFKNKKDTQSLIIDVETNIQYLDNSSKTEIRSDIYKAITEKRKKQPPFQNDKTYSRTVQKLQEKNVFYLKADKGNSIVILDKEDYFERVTDMLNNGPYKVCLKTPIKKFTTSTLESLKQCKKLIDPNLYKKLVVPNPVLPRLYGLPKIHKQGKQMRPIVSSINSPTYLLSKWLQNQFKRFNKFPSLSIKNRYDFIQSVKNINIEQNEILVSFDVTALYPSVPIDKTLILVKDWLNSINLNAEEIEEYMILTNLCMRQNTFQFNNNYYSQTDGTAMGNPLSCFIADVFMSHFEHLAKNTLPYFPRVWFRYVDDVFAVFDQHQDINKFVKQLNSIYPTIKFTHEIESNQSIPFLDVLVIRNLNKIEFDIYRKPTHTNRFITNDSYHPPEQKRAVFHSLIFRLLNTPISEENFNKELNYIKEIAKFNGYTPSLINNILKKSKKKHEKFSRTKLLPIKENNTGWLSTTYTEHSKSVKKTFKKHGNKIISFNTKNNLKIKLPNPKDQIKEEDQAGIYQINCNDCEKHYIGQTRRNIKTRYKEHYAHIKFNRPEKSAIAHHCLSTGHSISQQNLKILKQVSTPKYLNAFETLYINLIEKEKLLNNEDGPIQNSKLLQPRFIKTL